MTGPDAMASEIKKGSGRTMLLGVLLVILGVLAMGAPLVTGMAITFLVGTCVVLGGAVQLVFALSAPSGGRKLFAALLGLLTLAIGIYMLVHPLFGLGALTLALAIYFLVEGVAEIAYAFQMKPAQGWGWALFSGVVTLALGWMIWRDWPVSGVWAIGLLVGIKILLSGWMLIAMGGSIRAMASAAQR
jgi:uncharacterized membrane protein HdeD (DUF308 family)